MVNLEKSVEELKQKFTKSPEIAKKAIKEIVLLIENQDNERNKLVLAFNFSCYIANLAAGGIDHFGAFSRLYLELSKYIQQEYFGKFLCNLRNYFNTALTKEKFPEAIILLPLLSIDREDILDEKSIQEYFYINKISYMRLILSANLKDNYVSQSFDNLIKVFKVARRILNSEISLNLIDETLNSNSRVLLVVKKHAKESERFFRELIAHLIKETDKKSIDKLFIVITKLLSVILTHEIYHKNSSFDLSYSLTKNALSATIMVQSDLHKKSLTVVHFFLKVLCSASAEKFEDLTAMIKTLWESHKSTIAAMDVGVTVSQILSIASDRWIAIFQATESKRQMFQFLKQVMRILPLARYDKTFCPECKSLHRHEIYRLSLFTIKLMNSAIESKFDDHGTRTIFMMIIQYIFTVLNDFKCPHAESMLENLFITLLKCVRNIDSEEFADFGLNVIKIIMKYEDKYDSTYNLVVFLRNMYRLKKNYENELKFAALAVVVSCDRNPCEQSMIRVFSNCNSLYEKAGLIGKNKTIADLIGEINLPLKIPTFDSSKLISLQLDAALVYACNEKLKQFLIKKAIETCESEIDFSTIIAKIGNYSVPGLNERIMRAIQTMSKKMSTANCKDLQKMRLALAQLYYRLTQFKIDKAKTMIAEKQAFDDEMLETIDCLMFNNVTISVENKILEAATKTTEYFHLFFENFKEEDEISIDWIVVLDKLQYLARQFNLRGYTMDSFKTWQLIYGIAKKSNQSLLKIQAIGFFAENSHLIKEIDPTFNLGGEIEANFSDITENLKKIDGLTPRQKNYVLSCLICLSQYYLRQEDYDECMAIAEIVAQRQKEIRKDADWFGIIDVQIVALDFLISSYGEMVCSPFSFACRIMDVIRNSIMHLTSEDSVNIPMFLFRTVRDLTYYCINRFSYISVKPFLRMLLKFAVNSGLSLRASECLTLLVQGDLQIENFRYIPSKLVLIDVILMNELNTAKKCLFDPPTPAKPTCNVSKGIAQYLTLTHPLIEPVRRTTFVLSPENVKVPQLPPELQIGRYFVEHKRDCTCELCKNQMFQMVAFQVGCLRARYEFFMENYRQSETMFVAAFDWWKVSMAGVCVKLLNYQNALWMINFYLNVLRKQSNFTLALEICEYAFDYYEKYMKIFDCAHIQILVEQKVSIDYCLNEKYMFDKMEFNEKAENMNVKIVIHEVADTVKPKMKESPDAVSNIPSEESKENCRLAIPLKLKRNQIQKHSINDVKTNHIDDSSKDNHIQLDSDCEVVDSSIAEQPTTSKTVDKYRSLKNQANISNSVAGNAKITKSKSHNIETIPSKKITEMQDIIEIIDSSIEIEKTDLKVDSLETKVVAKNPTTNEDPAKQKTAASEKYEIKVKNIKSKTPAPSKLTSKSLECTENNSSKLDDIINRPPNTTTKCMENNENKPSVIPVKRTKKSAVAELKVTRSGRRRI